MHIILHITISLIQSWFHYSSKIYEISTKPAYLNLCEVSVFITVCYILNSVRI